MPEANVVSMKVRRPKAATAPTPAPAKAMKTAAKAKAPKATAAEKAPKVSRFVGATSGLSVKEFQNQSLARNFKAKLTDEQLAESWREEFPNAVAYTVEHVAGVRNSWNKGLHGNDAPAKPLHPYAEDGTELPLWGDKSRAVKEKKAAAAAAAAAEATAAKAAKKAAKAAKIGKTA